MTEQMVKQIKKILKKENVKIEAFYHARNAELRVKVISFVNRSIYGIGVDQLTPTGERNRVTQRCVIDVLRALTKNGLRPEYRTEQRESTNAIGTFDCRYVIFK